MFLNVAITVSMFEVLKLKLQVIVDYGYVY